MAWATYRAKLGRKGIDINLPNKLLKTVENISKPDLNLHFVIPIDKTDRYVVEVNVRRLTYFKRD